MNPQPKPQRAPKAKKPLSRKAPLRRSRMRRKPARRLKREGANRGYVAWLHGQRCVGESEWVGWGTHQCHGVSAIQQSHERNMTGMGRKEPDLRSVPMCRSLHEQWEQHRGRFDGWPKTCRRDWMAARIAETNAAWFALTEDERARWAGTQTQGESR